MNNQRTILENKNIIVEIAPACGGSITRFDYKYNNLNIAIFRRCEDELIKQCSALGASCFPLMPYSNRLRDGKFMLEGQQYRHELNCPPEIHSSHGDAWMRPWSIIKAAADFIEMRIQATDEQPIKYTGTQIIRLEKNAISVLLKVTNNDVITAPFGIGLHPYFPRKPETQLQCDLDNEWTLDNELMPDQLLSNSLKGKMQNSILVNKLPIAGAYFSRSTDASISLPSSELVLRITTKPPMQHAIIWCPTGQNYFCYEPVSHMIDGFNRSDAASDNSLNDSTGVMYLSPNTSFEATWTFSICHKGK